MTKFRIEISKPYQVLIWFGIASVVTVCCFPIVIAILSKKIFFSLNSIIFIGFIWLFIRIYLLKITITDKSINLNVANHKFCNIPISNITSVRFGNENDCIDRGNPVFSKNVIAIEYLNKKREKSTLYFSVSKQDSESIIRLLVKYGCNFEVNNPRLYK